MGPADRSGGDILEEVAEGQQLTCHEPGRVEEVGEPEGGVRVRHGGQAGRAAGGLHCRARSSERHNDCSLKLSR